MVFFRNYFKNTNELFLTDVFWRWILKHSVDSATNVLTNWNREEKIQWEPTFCTNTGSVPVLQSHTSTYLQPHAYDSRHTYWCISTISPPNNVKKQLPGIHSIMLFFIETYLKPQQQQIFCSFSPFSFRLVFLLRVFCFSFSLFTPYCRFACLRAREKLILRRAENAL